MTVNNLVFKEHSSSRGQMNRNDLVIVAVLNTYYQSQVMYNNDLVGIIFHDNADF